MAKSKSSKVTKTAPETKADKFKRLGEARVGKALKTISLIGNLSGSGYEYTAEQVSKITAALENAVTDTMARFNPRSESAKAPAIQL